MVPFSLYLHVPFCIRRCTYCDFFSSVGLEELIPGFTDAICTEIKLVGASAGEKIPVHSIYFGGGTPSLLSIPSVKRILNAIECAFQVMADVEITLEGNPGTMTAVYLADLKNLGINRLSLGMQSAQPDELRLLGRIHEPNDVPRMVDWARKAGFKNLSLDLIYGIPGQGIESWKSTLKLALGLNPEHLSLYSLTLEAGTLINRWAERGLIDVPDDDIAAEMYELAESILAENGFTQYEISNWAQHDKDGLFLFSRHNMQYWLNQPYLGFGPAAHGCAGGKRLANVADLSGYIQRCNVGKTIGFPAGPAVEEIIPVDTFTEMQETMLLGLRLTRQGVSRQDFTHRYGIDPEKPFGREIRELLKNGLIEWVGEDKDILRLTKRGRLLGNLVFQQFVGDNETKQVKTRR